MDTKLKIFGGLSIAFGLGGLYAYLQLNESQSKKIAIRLNEIRESIDEHFANCTKEDLPKLLDDKQRFMDQLVDAINSFVDFDELNDQIKDNKFLQSLQASNLQVQLFNIEYISFYLRRQSLSIVNAYFKDINTKQTLPSQVQVKCDQSLSLFLFNTFLFIIQAFEEILLDLNNKHKLVQINFYFAVILDLLTEIYKKYPLSANLLAQVLVSPTDLYKTKKDQFSFGHTCEDPYYVNQVKDLTQNNECKCLVLDLLTRYSSLITPTIQKKILTILIDHQVFQTEDHLVILGKTLLQNSFYLGSQIAIDSMYYIADVSVFNHMLIQALVHPKVRERILSEHIKCFDHHMLYIERVITQNNPKFWARLLGALISYHCMLFPLFDDPKSIQALIADEGRQTSTLLHFMGILLIIETAETFEMKKNDNKEMMDWLAKNMDTLLANEVICFLQIQFITTIIKHQQTHAVAGRAYLQCLRVTQNNRIQARQNKIKQFEINAGLTKGLGYLILGMTHDQLITRAVLKKSLANVPFQDKTERINVFTNVIRILFDLPSMNLHFLKFIAPRCEQVSKEALTSFNGYYTHILTSTTLSFDTYMITLQMGMLFGNPDILLGEIKARMVRDLSQFEVYKDFLTRDLILLVDLLENPYYALNVLTQQNKTADIQEIVVNLHQRAAMAIMQLNKKLPIQQLLDTLQLFVHIKELPQHVKEILIMEEDGSVQLRSQYAENQPYMALQKDMESVTLYLTECPNKYDELIYAAETFPFLRQLRQKLFKSQNFIDLFLECIKHPNRKTIQVWLAKFLYYAKQHLLTNKKIELVQKLFEEESVKTFIEELSSEPGTEVIVKYLRG